MKQIYSKQSVGDICSRFFDGDGNISSEEINKRTIGIELEELKLKKRSILVAGGNRKIKAIDGALRGGYANVLIIDQHTAKELLHYQKLEIKGVLKINILRTPFILLCMNDRSLFEHNLPFKNNYGYGDTYYHC